MNELQPLNTSKRLAHDETLMLYGKVLSTEQSATIHSFLRIETREADGALVAEEAFQLIIAARNHQGTLTASMQTWSTAIGGNASGMTFAVNGAGNEVQLVATANAAPGRQLRLVSGFFEV